MKRKINIGKNNMDLQLLAEKMLLNPSEKINDFLPHYQDMLSTGIVGDVLFEQLKPSEYGFHKNISLHICAMMLREDYIQNYGYALLSEKLLKSLSEVLKDKKVLEVGAGSGFLSYNLQNLGVDITPVDFKNVEHNLYGFTHSYTNIINEDAVKHLSLKNQLPDTYDFIIMSWPCLGTDFANNVLKQMKTGQKLIYIGERGGGCTANDKFFDSLEKTTDLDQNLTDKLQHYSLNFSGLHDDWYVYSIK